MQMLVLGAGQLARMMALVAAPLDIHIRAYDVASKQVVHPVTGETIKELSEGSKEKQGVFKWENS